MITATTYAFFDRAFANISAYAILKDGKPVGRVVIKYGAGVTAYVQAWLQPMARGQARGGGYDRATAAVQAAAAKLSPDMEYPREGRDPSELAAIKAALTAGNGGTRWQSLLEDAGYTLALVVG